MCTVPSPDAAPVNRPALALRVTVRGELLSVDGPAEDLLTPRRAVPVTRLLGEPRLCPAWCGVDNAGVERLGFVPPTCGARPALGVTVCCAVVALGDAAAPVRPDLGARNPDVRGLCLGDAKLLTAASARGDDRMRPRPPAMATGIRDWRRGEGPSLRPEPFLRMVAVSSPRGDAEATLLAAASAANTASSPAVPAN